MRNLSTRLTAGIMMFAFTQSHAGDNYWKKFDGKTAPSQMPMSVSVKDYNIFTLDQSSMRSFLFGLGTDYDKAQQILLPTPDRKYRSFHIWNVPMMEPGLAEKYPDIRTFTAVADDDPYVTAKVEFTLFGLTALVFDGDKTYAIDPYSNAADGYYVVFYQNNYMPSNVPSGSCGLNSTMASLAGNGTPVNVEEGGGRAAAKLNGSVRHTYRLAMSCTGEYAVNVAGANPSKAQVLSKIVTTVDRVNGFYERELSVHMNLIANNDDVIYVNAANDPYNCNLNLDCLIGEVQSNITSVIGTQNYDIGHILCTAGGGLAQLWAVCGGGKASGTSTSGGPDDYHVILHEMGHQFGSNHTFSANSGGCNGNGNEQTAYEPGAGNSTMSYSGACDPNNVGAGTDYFHVSSLNEISSFLTSQGSTCGTTATGTTPPNVPALIDSFYIPKNTPFELMAPLVTAAQSSEAIRYSWEQWDLGNFGETEAQNGSATSGPIVRSYPPVADRLRSYPSTPRVIDGSYTAPGERLPSRARTVRFKLTARNIYQGWGTFQFIDSVVRLKVMDNATTFRVTSQATPTTWNPAETKTVQWNVSGTDQDSVSCRWVNIYLSLDDGATFPFLMVANAPNTGSYNVTVPDVYTTSGRVKVKGAGNVFYDINKGAITINGNPNGVKELELVDDMVFYPNPATDRIRVMMKKHVASGLSAVMYNALGQRVWAGSVKNDTEIAVGGMARGHYLIQVVDGAARSTYKVLLK